MIASLMIASAVSLSVSAAQPQQRLDVDSGLRCGGLFMVLASLPEASDEDKAAKGQMARRFATWAVPQAQATGLSIEAINARVRQDIATRRARLDAAPAGQARQSLTLEWDAEEMECLSRAAATGL